MLMPLDTLRIRGNPNIGVYIFANNKVALVPKGTESEVKRKISDTLNVEVKELRDVGLNVHVVHTVFTALGNIILANDKAVMFHKEIEDHELERMVRILDVNRFRKGSIAGIPTVGSVAVITDKGGVVHPDVSDDELEGLSEFFGVPLDVGTVNFGVAFIKTGLVANNYGALVGEKTTGPEIMRIMKALNMR